MNVKKIAVASMAGLMLGGIPMASGASVVSANDVNMDSTQQTISEHVEAIADKYIHFNGAVFVLSDDAKSELTEIEFSQVEQQVRKTNDILVSLSDKDLQTNQR